ncbi:hypothetical protein [Anatilimnocola floriformis]|uniref:hypothetical protein n=1 Tax=Anatilimnocola floriformis TaxID=2948575 RepID=UPI0020C263AD|nr:hypothetical protein [Anatilimnocola floriformis]
MSIRRISLPPRRPLKIFALDPMLGRVAGNSISIDVATEPLRPGPVGSRISVVDYDGERRTYYEPINLNSADILMQGGLDPSEADPRFHQQMVYAVAMKVIENFERALGRKITFRPYRKRPQLMLLPHAFRGANAYYDRQHQRILFGYFQADQSDPGPNLPGQNVFTCLSHDIIAHEMTHAIVDSLREHFIEPSNRDVWAFHEGFSDIVAIFQHFSFADILLDQIQSRGPDLRSPTPLVSLAQQFGYATGKGDALRSAIDLPDPRLYQQVTEPHDRGSILVAAVFDAFFNTYQRRIRDVIRIGTGGTGRLPEGDLHPDLVKVVSDEASKTAQGMLSMCIRAFEYLPPVDITYGDYLRALVTADYELSPQDPRGLRGALIEAFRVRGIFPRGVSSLAEESLLWPRVERELPPFPTDLLGKLFVRDVTVAQKFRDFDGIGQIDAINKAKKVDQRIFVRQLREYAKANAAALALDPDRELRVLGFHFVFRVASDGQLLIELVVQFDQFDDSEQEELGGLLFRGGTTVIASAEGTVRYVIAKPLRSAHGAGAAQRDAETRFQQQREFAIHCSLEDPHFAWCKDMYAKNHMAEAAKAGFAAIHRSIR